MVILMRKYRFEEKGRVGRVCKQKKSFYGLKHSPWAWFTKLDTTLGKLGYQQSQVERTLLIEINSRGKRYVLTVYVNDITITNDDCPKMMNLKQQFEAKFKVKTLGSMRYFPSMEMARCKEESFISQRKYTLDLLKETRMLRCKPTSTTLDRDWKCNMVLLQQVKGDTKGWQDC